MKGSKAVFVLLALALAASSCMRSGLGMSLGEVPEAVEGNVVSIPVEAGHVEIVPPDGSSSTDSGHFHVFIDRDPLAEGETIPREPGIVHSAENPIKLYGLSPGSHEFTVVVGDGRHVRFGPDFEESVTVDVRGPSVDATAPATIKEGQDLKVELEADGVDIVAADGKRDGKTGHFHVLVDPKVAPEAGNAITAPVENSVIHTTEGEAVVKGLAKGEHTLWVVLGDGQHYAYDPPVMDKLTVTVE